ncbi:glycoside hydrolase family 32 protein [soil metagenome]
MHTEHPQHREEHPDPAFPRLHGRPDRGWVNDPNGCSYVDGRYHLFFQHNPDRSLHAAIKWGHVSSTDLVHWRHEPIALVNRPGELDAYGCWSGCVVDDAGAPTAVYSGVVDDGGRCQVLLARSDRRMQTWVPESGSVAGMPDDPAVTDVRDPFVFELAGHRYAVQGAGHRRGQPQLLVYGCDDLRAWTPLGRLLTTADRLAATAAPANVWECPNLVRVDDRWVLLVSLWRRVGDDFSLDGVRWFVGDLADGPAGPRFTPRLAGELDSGPTFYAPRVLPIGDRVLLWGWSREDSRNAEEVAAAGWAGVLTFARELSLVDDVLVSRPAAELDALRREPLPVVSGEPFEAAAFDLDLGGVTGPVSLWLVDGDDADAGTAARLVAEWDISPTPLVPPRVLVDGSIIEIFDGGPVARTVRAYPTATSRWVVRTMGGSPVSGWLLGLAAGSV